MPEPLTVELIIAEVGPFGSLHRVIRENNYINTKYDKEIGV